MGQADNLGPTRGVHILRKRSDEQRDTSTWADTEIGLKMQTGRSRWTFTVTGITSHKGKACNDRQRERSRDNDRY